MEHAVGEVCTLCSGLPDCCCGGGGGGGGGATTGEWSTEEEVWAEVEGNPYCTGRSTAGNGVCVCVLAPTGDC